MSIYKYSTILFFFFFFISCSKRPGTTQTIIDDEKKTRTEIETISSGKGGGITGREPSYIKVRVKEYDSLNRLIYESYKETSLSGCLANTEKWNVTARTADGVTKELELLSNDSLMICYKNRAGQIDSTITIPFSDCIKIDWLKQDDW